MTGFIRTTFLPGLPDSLNPSFLPSGRQTRPDRSSHRKRDHLVPGVRGPIPIPSWKNTTVPYDNPAQEKESSTVILHNSISRTFCCSFIVIVLTENIDEGRVPGTSRIPIPRMHSPNETGRETGRLQEPSGKLPARPSRPPSRSRSRSRPVAVSYEPWRCARLPSATAGTPTRPRTYPLFRPTPSRNGLSGKSFPETCPPRRWRTRSTTACETTTWTPGSQRSRQSTERGQEDA